MRTATLTFVFVSVFAFAFALTVAATPAQQVFDLAGGASSFASRGNLGRSSGEIHQGVHASHHRGVLDTGSRCAVDTVVFTVQDLNGATRENVYAVLRSGSDSSGPGARIAQIGPFFTPRGTGRVSWTVRLSSSSPTALPDCTSFFSVGVRLFSTIANDGLYVHLGLLSNCTHSRVGNHSWDIVSGQNKQSSPPRTWNIQLVSKTASFLQNGNGGRSYGLGGLFPKRGCTLTTRTRFPARTFAGGNSLAYGSLSRTNGFALFPNTARLYLSAPNVFLGSAGIGNTGEAVLTLTASLPALTPGPTLHVQAVGVAGRNVALTNTQGITP